MEALARTEVLHEAMQVEAMAESASRRLEKQEKGQKLKSGRKVKTE
jgi:hypothetical protein